MTRILLTGFEPFAGSTINPSAEVVRSFADTFPVDRLHTTVLPVDVVVAPAQLSTLLRELRPDWCVMLGEARGRAAISLERVAINMADFRIPDNGGHQPCDEPVVAAGPAAYFSTLPLRDLTKAVQQADVPVELSLSAGAYVCNALLYMALHQCATDRLPTRCGFVHLPALPAQVADTTTPTLTLEQSRAGVAALVAALIAR